MLPVFRSWRVQFCAMSCGFCTPGYFGKYCDTRKCAQLNVALLVVFQLFIDSTNKEV